MDQNVIEYTRRLKDEGIEAISGPNVRQLTDSQKELALRVAIFGAFYPNYFSRAVAFNPAQVERDAVNCLNGLDPYTTVRLGGFPPYQPAKAYMRQIKENLNDIFGNLFEMINLKMCLNSFNSNFNLQLCWRKILGTLSFLWMTVASLFSSTRKEIPNRRNV